MGSQIDQFRIRLWGLPALVAVVAAIALLSSIDGAGDYPRIAQGPGVAIDEVFNVQEGVRLIVALKAFALGDLEFQHAFGEREDVKGETVIGYHNPDHPPFGRFWIGIVHEFMTSLFPADLHPQNNPFVTSAARVAPAIAFAVLIVVVGLATSCWYGTSAGFLASLSLVFMPRLFGQAHLAVLETFLALSYTVVVLSVASFWGGEEPPSRKIAAVTGILFGIALLTKIQAVFLPIPISMWAVVRWRNKAILPLMIWGGVGFLFFFIGWPWLWFDPLHHLVDYFGRATDRVPLNVWYFGEKYSDRFVPWHYALVMFLTTVPIGLHLLGIVGTFKGEVPAWKSSCEQLVLANLLFPLVIFSLPGTPVYDGTRLFLMVFPLWAVLIGRGSVIAWNWLTSKLPVRTAAGVFGCLLVFQGYGLVVMWPCHLGYYNLLVGGSKGAEHLGLETDYWGGGVTRSFLKEVVEAVPENSEIEFGPLLHQFQLKELLIQSPVLRRHGIRVRPIQGNKFRKKRYVLFFQRKADLADFQLHPPEYAKLLVEFQREGVQLAALYEFAERE